MSKVPRPLKFKKWSFVFFDKAGFTQLPKPNGNPKIFNSIVFTAGPRYGPVQVAQAVNEYYSDCMTKYFLPIALTLMTSVSFARKSCEELKSEIDTKLKAKGVQNYTLDIVDTDKIKDEKVVGSCDGGSKKITYLRK